MQLKASIYTLVAKTNKPTQRLLFCIFVAHRLCCEYVLRCAEGEVEVVPPVLRVQLLVVEGVRVEVVDERAEGHAVVPAGGEVLHVHVLRESETNKTSKLSFHSRNYVESGVGSYRCKRFAQSSHKRRRCL